MECLIVLGVLLAVWIFGHVILTAMDSHYTLGHYAKCWRCRMFSVDPGRRG